MKEIVVSNYIRSCTELKSFRRRINTLVFRELIKARLVAPFRTVTKGDMSD